jgi:hypothetical protein
MNSPSNGEWRELLRLLLSMRLELNAIESVLKGGGVLTNSHIKEIRAQARDTAKAWSLEPADDVLKLIRIHSSPGATMAVPPLEEG